MLEETASKIKAKLKQINDEEVLEAANIKRKISNIDKTSILRDKRPTTVQSMNVDKWIEVHKRQNRQTALDFLNKNILVHNSKDNSTYTEKKMIKTGSKSRRELANSTVLDNVQKTVKRELEETLKKIKRVETNNEFNSLVDKVKNFLFKWEVDYGRPLEKYADEQNSSIIQLCYKNLQDNRSLNHNFQTIGYQIK